MNEKYNKIAGSLIGGAIGDALGYQIEFSRNIKEKQVTRFDKKGIISDDTQMTLFTAVGLLWRETRLCTRGIAMMPADAIHLAYKDWLETQTGIKNEEWSISWIKDIPELNDRRAPGNTCLSALESGKMGKTDEPINNSKGCGSVMRVAPIGLYGNNPKISGEVAAQTGAITHGHPLGIIPCYVMGNMLNTIVNKKTTIIDALNNALKDLKDYNKFDEENINIFLTLVNKAVELSNENKSDIESISELGEGWVAEEAFAIAIYSCLKYKDSFEDTVVCAVNHDGDSDSTGSIAGNIIGASLGLKNIPNYYLEDLELKDTILEIAHDLSIEIPVDEFSSNNDEEWLDKYLYCKKKQK